MCCIAIFFETFGANFTPLLSYVTFLAFVPFIKNANFDLDQKSLSPLDSVSRFPAGGFS
jgi:hypothetical protein